MRKRIDLKRVFPVTGSSPFVLNWVLSVRVNLFRRGQNGLLDATKNGEKMTNLVNDTIQLIINEKLTSVN